MIFALFQLENNGEGELHADGLTFLLAGRPLRHLAYDT